MASYDSQYRKYLDSVPQDNTQGNPLLNKALGVAATGGAIYAAYKTGVLSAGLESAIGLGAKTRLNALKTEAFEESLRENLARHNMRDMFNPRFYREIQAGYNLRVNRIEQEGVFGQNTAAIGRRIEVNSAQESLTSYITNALRFKNVTSSIDEARFGSDASAIQDAVQKYNSWKLFRNDSAGTASQVLGDLKLNGDRGVIVDQLSNRIKEARELYHGDTIHQNQEFNTIYNNIVGQLQEQYNLSLRGRSSSQSWFEKVLEGTKYKRATIKDMADANAFAPTAKPSMQIDPVTKQTSFTEQTMDWNQHFKDLIKDNPAIGDLYADGGVFVDQASGKLVDLRHIGSGFRKRLEYLSTDFEVPFIGLNPLRLLHISSLNSTRNAPFTKFYQRGEFDVVLAGGKDPLQSHVLVAGRKAFDLSTGETIKDNIYLASAIYGVIPKAMYAMAGYERAEVVRAKEHAGWLRKVFDFNFQEYESAPGKIWGAVTKWSNPEWARNKYKYFEGVVGDSTIIRHTDLFQKIDADIDVLGEAYHDIYNILNSRTGTLSIEQTVRLAGATVNNGGKVQTVASLYGMTPDEFATAINDNVYTIGKRMIEQITGGDAALDTAPTRDKLLQHIEKYTSNPMYYGKKFRLASGEKAPFMDDVFSMREDYGTKRIGFTEDTLRYLQMDMLWQVQRFSGSSESVAVSLTKGAMRNDATNVENMLVLNNIMGRNAKLFNQIIVDGAKDSTAKAAGINELVSNLGSIDDPWTLNTLSERMMRYTPAWGSGPGLPPPEYLSKEYMVVNRAVNPLRVVNDLIKSGASLNEVVQAAAKSTIGQLGLGPSGFRAGRNNMDDVTTATIASYFGVQRLEQALGSMHLGLSNASMGSPQDVYLNLVGRRMIMPALLIGYAGYGNYLVDKITGINPKETAADAYVNARVRMAGFKDVTGINALFKRMSNIFPGADQMVDWMGVKALNTLTFGAFSSQTSQEAYDYYYGEGVDPIRKGRFWPAGSNTPWSGGRISYFEPNWYRRLKTDYLMSDSMYGSRSEYYANQWYPTLSNPLGPIKSILLDPNHWYNKHYNDRPYPSSGGAPFLDEIPIIGPAAAGILDKLGIVPDTKRGGLEKAHMDYLRAINDYIKTGAQGYGYTTPSGKTAPVTLYPGAQGQVGSGGGTYGVAVNGAGGIPVYGHLGYGAAQARGNLAAINNGIVMRGAIANMRFSTPDMYRDLVDVVDLDTVESPTGASYRAGETYYSLTEMAGIYGFALSSFVTGDNKPQPGLATATYMASSRHRFWEQNLGGLGGNLSEIFRRFLPNDKYRRNAYNPYRNTMPEWLPLEFRYGDPYTMPRGEARMPGDAYERLHKLHPDEFGEYGAIDRVKILADVAPYSEEYRLWLNIARAMPLTAAGRKEVTAADDRVSAVKRKYRFYPYRFSGLGDITEQTLHVTKEIDQNTWLTAEYPNNPIRLAAIHVPQSDPKAEEARARVGEYLYSGATVKVGMNADLSQRFKNDTMNTIPVVVYTREGKSLQRELLAEYGDVIKEKKIDNNPVTIHAMFNKEERIVGRLWEHFAHLDTPWHCIAPWTKVITKDGIKTAEEIKGGDMVLTHKGQFKPVVYSQAQPVGKKIVDVKLSSSNILLTVTDDHPILACKSERKKRITSHSTGEKLEPYGKNPKIEFVLAGDLQPYDYVVYKPRIMSNVLPPLIDFYVLSPDTFVQQDGYVYTKLSNGKAATHRQYMPQKYCMNNELARLLGYYAAEGCTSKARGHRQYTTFTFSADEDIYINDVTNIVERQFGIKATIVTENNTTHVKVGSRFLAEFVYHFVGAKTQKVVPEELLTNHELRAEFIRGLLRGDGTKTRQVRYDCIGMAALNILIWLRDALFNMWKIPASISLAIDRTNPLYMLYIGAYPEFAEFIDSDGIYTQQVFEQNIKNRDKCVVNDYIFYRIKTVKTSEYQGITYDIEVEDDDTFATITCDVHNTKFMHVRSPLEEYRRSIVYGKEWQPWTEPVQSILVPTLQAIAAKPPVTAIAFTGGLGFLMGSTFGPARKMLTIGGMAIGGMLSTTRVLGESISGHTYIPGRVKKQREIDEYFDKLKYLKYKGLYERARKIALKLEGIDIGTVLDNKQGKGKTNKEANKYLTEIKHLAKLYPESERMVAMNKTINKIKAAQAQQRSLSPLGPYALQAMYYRAQYEGTMYGADPYGDFTQVYRAMPKREREFFNEFIKAKPSERAQILNVVPDEEKRFLQAKWGMEVDEPETLQAYFGKHHLPTSNWSGWRPDVSLDDIKLKVVRNEAMDIGDFGFWEEDIPYSQAAPSLSMNSSNVSLFGIQNRILRIMRGAGLRDVDIRINHGPATEAMTYNVNVSVENDSSKQFVNNINQNMYRLGDVINT